MSETRELGRDLRKGHKVSKEDTKKLDRGQGKFWKGKTWYRIWGGGGH